MTDPTPVRYIEAITRRYEQLGYAAYRWFEADTDPPLTPMRKPLTGARIGLLSTSGAYVLGQVAYHYKDDTSLRGIPQDTPVSDLRFAHLTENYLEDSRRDPNCTFPLEALRALASEGAIGALPDELLSCMGAIYSQRRVREELVPAVEARFCAQGVDAALLVPM